MCFLVRRGLFRVFVFLLCVVFVVAVVPLCSLCLYVVMLLLYNVRWLLLCDVMLGVFVVVVFLLLVWVDAIVVVPRVFLFCVLLFVVECVLLGVVVVC